MKIFSELKKVTKLLEKHTGQWAICGGVAASIYRNTPRYTDDIDFALIDSDKISAKDLASKIILELGYEKFIGLLPDSINQNKQVKSLISAREINDDSFIGLDFLLPIQPWVKEAVTLAQSNTLDYGFSKLPTITPESLIFAKLIALNNNFQRYKDMDDIKEILKNKKVNLKYINERISLSKIVFKKEVLEFIT